MDWFKKLFGWVTPNPDADRARAVRYFRAQLCSLDAHAWKKHPRVDGAQRCEWCMTMREDTREWDPLSINKWWTEGMERGLYEKVDRDILGMHCTCEECCPVSSPEVDSEPAGAAQAELSKASGPKRRRKSGPKRGR